MADNQLESNEAVADSEDSKSVVQKGLDGISILEVYSVTYLGSYPMEAEDQIGSISFETNDMRHYLYYVRKVDTSKPSIKYGDQLPMWDKEPICNFTDLVMKVDGFSDEYEGVDFSGEPVGFPKVLSHSPKDGDLLKKLSMRSIDGYNRKFSVLFGCFSNATVANLEVIFSPGVTCSDATTNVYGRVVASNSKFDHPSSRSYLFSREPASTIQVGHNDWIPLSRSRVGVPLDSQLNVSILLFCDDIQHKGTAKFIPSLNGTQSEKVCDQILVKVTWNIDEDPVYTDEDSDFTDEFDSASV